MPRKPRIEFAGAIYHVLSRGNRGDSIFLDERDCGVFLDTLDEVCGRTGWLIHAFVLMGNHYHLLLETPEPNLVAGMKWLQGTYTQRFNSRHGERGHLLQGRYKALLVESSEENYFPVVGNYIHLNPARAKCVDLKSGNLSDYRWSSYSLYLQPSRRPGWLRTDRILGAMGLLDDRSGRGEFRRLMQKRVVEIVNSSDPAEADEAWSKIRRGWYLGSTGFRDELLGRLDEVVGVQGKRESFDGAETILHDEREAGKLLESSLRALSLQPEDLGGMRKSCVEKCCMAWLIRKRTCVSNEWIKQQLKMGKATNFSALINQAEMPKGAARKIMDKLKNIKISD